MSQISATTRDLLPAYLPVPVLLAIVDTCSPGESGKIFVCNQFLVKGGKEKKVLPRRTEKSINQSHLLSQPGDVFPGSVVTAGGVVPGVVPGSVVPAGGVVPTTQLVCCTCGRKVLSLKVKIQFNLGRIPNLFTHPIYLERENNDNCL